MLDCLSQAGPECQNKQEPASQGQVSQCWGTHRKGSGHCYRHRPKKAVSASLVGEGVTWISCTTSARWSPGPGQASKLAKRLHTLCTERGQSSTRLCVHAHTQRHTPIHTCVHTHTDVHRHNQTHHHHHHTHSLTPYGPDGKQDGKKAKGITSEPGRDPHLLPQCSSSALYW